MNLNTKLGIGTAILALLSVWSFVASQGQGERFERGQKFLPNLNAGNIAEVLIKKNGETTNLKRSGDNYLVVSSHNYPAKNEAVNRFIRDVLKIELEKEIGEGASLETKLGMGSDSESMITVDMKNDAGKTMVSFVVGDALEGGEGSYIKRTDGDDPTLYLTSGRVYLNTDSSQFLKKQILNVAQTEVAKISGPDFTFDSEEGPLVLRDIPAGKKSSGKASSVKGALSNLSFDKVYVADDSEVAGLNFSRTLTFDLKDQRHYRLQLARKEDRTFLRVSGDHDLKGINQSELAALETDDQVKEKSEEWQAAVEMQEFNQFHGTWVYEVPSYIADKLWVSKSDLVEDVEKDS